MSEWLVVGGCGGWWVVGEWLVGEWVVVVVSGSEW